jgi:hypothetical protein
MLRLIRGDLFNHQGRLLVKVFFRVVRLIAITGLLAMPYSAAQAWGGWGGPGW